MLKVYRMLYCGSQVISSHPGGSATTDGIQAEKL